MVLNEYFSTEKWEQKTPQKPQTGFVQDFTYDSSPGCL